MNYATQQTLSKPLRPGAIWEPLQAERSEVSPTSIEKARPTNNDTEAADESIREVEWRHCQNLQQCLNRIDGALDR